MLKRQDLKQGVFKCLWVFYCFLLLSSCQQPMEEQNSQPKLVMAAAYNAQLALAYLQQDDPVRAKRKLLLALTQDPQSLLANSSMAYYLEQCGEKEKAAFYYKKAMMLAPRAGSAWNNYGAFLCRQGHYQQAEAYFLKAANDLHYDNPAAAYENAGLCCLASGDHRKARRYFVNALEHAPTRAVSLEQLLKLDKTTSYGKKIAV